MAFTPNTFRFLRDLDANNDVAWFHANKQRYEDHVRTPALAIIEEWGHGLADTAYEGQARKVGGALAPPNKDVRFTKDKRPYRTHIAMRLRHRFLLPGAAGPTFLLWVAPGNVFLSAGVHAPRGQAIHRIRHGILADPDTWLKVRDLGEPDDSGAVARVPDAPAELRPDLQRSHYSITRRLRQADVQGREAGHLLVDLSRQMLPYNQFMEQALFGVVLKH